MMVRPVRGTDREHVLGFCKKTFGWGDYIDDDVWDSWSKDGIFFACDARMRAGRGPSACRPVGICHAHLSDRQVWIEGIRVDPQYRRRGIATMLVRAAEDAALGSGRTVSRMLIDLKNGSSLGMVRMLGYAAADTWIYHGVDLGAGGGGRPDGCLPAQLPDSAPTTGAGGGGRPDGCLPDIITYAGVDPAVCTHYVESWRWYETDDAVLRSMASDGMTAISTDEKNGPTYAVMTMRPSLGGSGRTLSGTVYPGSDRSVARMLAFLRGRALDGDCASLSVFAKRALPGTAGTSVFCLVEKSLGDGTS